jgi:hypothetical protein
MSAHTSIKSSIQFDFRRAIWRGAQLLVGSVSAALIIACISFGLEISVATARSGVSIPEDAPRQIVNHTHKGDRQQIAPASHQNAANRLGKIGASQAPALNLRLPVGCESMISPLANPLLARVARRCLS